LKPAFGLAFDYFLTNMGQSRVELD